MNTISQQVSAEWYAILEKPFFAPPAWLFGPVWSVLYILIAVSFGFVFVQILRKRIPFSVGVPFVLNAVANAAFTPLQFGLKSNILALIDILIVLLTIVWIMKKVWPYAHWVSVVQIPYLLWVGFATVLQFSIVFLNS